MHYAICGYLSFSVCEKQILVMHAEDNGRMYNNANSNDDDNDDDDGSDTNNSNIEQLRHVI